MLAQSSISSDSNAMALLEAIAGVIFLGTPHRGSPQLAAFGEFARSLVSSLRMATSASILEALSLKSSDLERSQHSFSALWYKHNFQVKTFQEGLGLSGVNLGVLGNKVVPDYSSLIGDQRERAETLQASHRDMCRFDGPRDPNYRKVSGEVRLIYNGVFNPPVGATIREQSGKTPREQGDETPREQGHVAPWQPQLSEVQKRFLRSLWYSSIHFRRQTITNPAENTCGWLFELPTYTQWLDGSSGHRTGGLLWLKGSPGAGKSVLMKEAFLRASSRPADPSYLFAAFFFSNEGDKLQSSPTGMLRSLLYQLLPQYPNYLQDFINNHWKHIHDDNEIGNHHWQEEELRSMLRTLLTKKGTRKTFLFIDALDECDDCSPLGPRKEAYFWRTITISARDLGLDLNVCLSSRHFPNITLLNFDEVTLGAHNLTDISSYVEGRFRLCILPGAEGGLQKIQERIISRSEGVFLWVVLVVDEVLRKWDEGVDVDSLSQILDVLPTGLSSLFQRLFANIPENEKESTLRFFQWILLSNGVLRLHEWHHILAFIKPNAPKSLRQAGLMQMSNDTVDQVERQIRSISRGLVKVKNINDRSITWDTRDADIESHLARAGSLDLEHGPSQLVHVIHETVRFYFYHGDGFRLLEGSNFSDARKSLGRGHISIMATCLDYIRVKELDSLVEARFRAASSGKSKGKAQARALARRNSVLSVSTLSSGDVLPVPHGNVTQDSRQQVTILSDAPALAPELQVLMWLEGDHCSRDTKSVRSLDVSSVSSRHSDVESQVLEAYPALLSYATFVFFEHARLAEAYGASPRPIIIRFQENWTWARWLALREDLLLDLDLFIYARSQGLSTWKRRLGLGYESPPGTPPPQSPIASRSQPYIRKRVSVASFGSASSHG